MQKTVLVLVAASMLTATAWAQGLPAEKVTATAEEIAALKTAVEKDFTNDKAHAEYIKAAGAQSAAVQEQYTTWAKAYPKMVAIPFAYAQQLYNKELPAAKVWLEKVVKLDPKNGKAYQMLSIDAERWGDFAGGIEYLRKATVADPSSADYAFYYASSLKERDSVQHHQLMLSMPDRYPNTERGAQALYWLAIRTEDPTVKVQVWELARTKFDPFKFNWAGSAMSAYFSYLLAHDAAKAGMLASTLLQNDSLRNNKQWLQNKEVAAILVNARGLSAQGKYAEAVQLLNTAPKMRYSSAPVVLLKEKAKALDAGGNTRAAYDSLLVQYAGDPTDEVLNTLGVYGNKLGKDKAVVQADVWKQRQSKAKPATPFNLYNYVTKGQTALPDLKGKVVLVTYWFPGCGPCRGEFPHFEAVVRKYSKEQLAYVAINIVPEQDEYVLPFVQKSGYSFTPVRDEADKRGNLVAVGAPTNYLLDKEGNIVFSNFRTDQDNHRTLELMINELLDK